MRDSSLFSNLSNTSRSSVLTSVSRRSKDTCCIGLKAVTVRTTAPSSNWKSLKSSAFNGSLITHNGRLRDTLPAKTRHSRVANIQSAKSADLPGADIATHLTRHGVNVTIEHIPVSEIDVSN